MMVRKSSMPATTQQSVVLPSIPDFLPDVCGLFSRRHRGSAMTQPNYAHASTVISLSLRVCAYHTRMRLLFALRRPACVLSAWCFLFVTRACVFLVVSRPQKKKLLKRLEMEKWQRHAGDTGSPECQSELLHESAHLAVCPDGPPQPVSHRDSWLHTSRIMTISLYEVVYSSVSVEFCRPALIDCVFHCAYFHALVVSCVSQQARIIRVRVHQSSSSQKYTHTRTRTLHSQKPQNKKSKRMLHPCTQCCTCV